MRTKADVPIEALAGEDLGLALVKLWAKAVRDEEARHAGPRKLVNTDGEDLVLTTDHFEVEPGSRARVNSKQRADRLRALVEQACAPSLRHRLREHADPTSSAQRAGAPRVPHEPTAEESEALRQLEQQHYCAWLDAPVAALGGKTPRQAVRTAKGRRQVDVLLRSFENGEHRMSDGAPFDFTPLRDELGLDVTGP